MVQGYGGTLASIDSMTLDFYFYVRGALARLFTAIFLEIDSHKIVLIRSDFEHLNPLRLIVPLHLNLCTR